MNQLPHVPAAVAKVPQQPVPPAEAAFRRLARVLWVQVLLVASYQLAIRFGSAFEDPASPQDMWRALSLLSNLTWAGVALALVRALGMLRVDVPSLAEPARTARRLALGEGMLSLVQAAAELMGTSALSTMQWLVSFALRLALLRLYWRTAVDADLPGRRNTLMALVAMETWRVGSQVYRIWGMALLDVARRESVWGQHPAIMAAIGVGVVVLETALVTLWLHHAGLRLGRRRVPEETRRMG